MPVQFPGNRRWAVIDLASVDPDELKKAMELAEALLNYRDPSFPEDAVPDRIRLANLVRYCYWLKMQERKAGGQNLTAQQEINAVWQGSGTTRDSSSR